MGLTGRVAFEAGAVVDGETGRGADRSLVGDKAACAAEED